MKRQARKLPAVLVLLCLFALPAAAQIATTTPGQRPPRPSPTATAAELESAGDVLRAEKDYLDALDYYEAALKKGQTAALWNKIGITQLQLTRFKDARKGFEKAIKLDRHYAEALNNLGVVWYMDKKYKKAIKFYKRALALNEPNASFYSNLGTAYFARKKYEDAAQAYQTALSLDPEVFEHRSSYGVMLQERSVEERAKFHYYLAKIYAQAGVNDRALQYIRRALEEGFKEKKKFLEEPEFEKLRDLAEFKELMALEPRVL